MRVQAIWCPAWNVLRIRYATQSSDRKQSWQYYKSIDLNFRPTGRGKHDLALPRRRFVLERAFHEIIYQNAPKGAQDLVIQIEYRGPEDHGFFPEEE